MPGLPAAIDNSPVLVMAGFDPSGCAGVSADLRALAAVEVQGVAVITAITFQNPLEFESLEVLPEAWLDAQLDCLLRYSRPRAVKIGMLGSARAVEWAAGRVEGGLGPVVLDPVVHATRGGRLIDEQGLEALKHKLIPLALAVTPNLSEAEALSGVRGIAEMEGIKAAAVRIHHLGAKHVVITGGHMERNCPDIWYDGKRFVILRSQRIDAGTVRGIGTLFSAVLAGHIAQGRDFEEALLGAKRIVLQTLAERDSSQTGPLVPSTAGDEPRIEVLKET